MIPRVRVTVVVERFDRSPYAEGARLVERQSQGTVHDEHHAVDALTLATDASIVAGILVGRAVHE